MSRRRGSKSRVANSLHPSLGVAGPNFFSASCCPATSDADSLRTGVATPTRRNEFRRWPAAESQKPGVFERFPKNSLHQRCGGSLSPRPLAFGPRRAANLWGAWVGGKWEEHEGVVCRRLMLSPCANRRIKAKEVRERAVQGGERCQDPFPGKRVLTPFPDCKKKTSK